jgi:hypothetical protein
METQTAVCLFIFNRPKTTALVFERLAQLKPKKLFLIADGPRTDRFGEIELCDKVRNIVSSVDWPCDVKRNYSDRNMGCKQRFSTGLAWVFDHVEEAIILEDDTLPDLSFFPFCDELLARYRSDIRVMHISGNFFQETNNKISESYYFSRYPHCWGWATWKRAWSKYDEEMLKWPKASQSREVRAFLNDEKVERYWKKIFNATFNNLIDSWAYRWVLACWLEGGLTIIPSRNLVTHIGAGHEAAHAKTRDKNIDARPLTPMKFPMTHPKNISRDIEADLYVDRNVFRIRGLMGRAFMKIAQFAGLSQ